MINMRIGIDLKKTTVIHILIVGFFIGYLLSANYIFSRVLTVDGEKRLMKIPQISYDQQVVLSIDKVEEKKINWKDMIEIVGWGFVEKMSTNKDHKIILVLTSEKKQLAFATDVALRPDVTKYFKDLNLNLDNSGFSTIIAKDTIPDGNYKMGLFIKSNDKKALAYSNNILIKKDGKIRLSKNKAN